MQKHYLRNGGSTDEKRNDCDRRCSLSCGPSRQLPGLLFLEEPESRLYAFKYGAMEEFGERDNHFEEDGEFISRKTIENGIDHGTAYVIWEDGKMVGGLVLKIDEVTQHNELELLFVHPRVHSKGIGYAAWQEVECLYPETKVWETCTPYFETRNIHFYVNKCGFHIVEFFNSHHPDPHDPETGEENNYEGEDFDGMFRFEKRMK